MLFIVSNYSIYIPFSFHNISKIFFAYIHFMSNSTGHTSDIISSLQHLRLRDLEKPTGFSSLPSEIVFQIFQLLPLEAAREASLVNMKWHLLVRQALYYAPTIGRHSLRHFINCLYYSTDPCHLIGDPNGHFIQELELDKPGRIEREPSKWPITISDMVFLFEKAPNITSLIIHNDDAHLAKLVYEAICICQPLRRIKRVEFSGLLDSKYDYSPYNLGSVGMILYFNAKILHYYRNSIEHISIPWNPYMLQTMGWKNWDGNTSILPEYPSLKKLKLKIHYQLGDLGYYWTSAIAGDSFPIDNRPYPFPSLISLIENNKEHAFTSLDLGYVNKSQMNSEDYHQLTTTLDAHVYSAEYPSLKELKITLGFFSASCIEYITQRFPQIPKLNIYMSGKNILQSAYNVQCLKILIRQMIYNRIRGPPNLSKDTCPHKAAQKLTILEREDNCINQVPFERNYISSYSSLIDFDQLCADNMRITLKFRNGEAYRYDKTPNAFEMQFTASRCFMLFRQGVEGLKQFQYLNQFLQRKGSLFHCLTLKQEHQELDLNPRYSSYSILDTIRLCPYLETLSISGYNEANFKTIDLNLKGDLDDYALGDIDALAFPRITYVSLHNIYWDSPASCSQLITKLFPRVRQLYFRYPKFFRNGSLNSTAVFDFSASRQGLSSFAVDIDCFFRNNVHKPTIQIELVAISKKVTYNLHLSLGVEKEPQCVTLRRGSNSNLKNPTVIFKFYYVSRLLLFYTRNNVMLRMGPEFNDDYYFFDYTEDMNDDHL
jgi:hypothetical protein